LSTGQYPEKRASDTCWDFAKNRNGGVECAAALLPPTRPKGIVIFPRKNGHGVIVAASQVPLGGDVCAVEAH
jgi:hypothetical protein